MARAMALLATTLLVALAATASAAPRRSLAEITVACEYVTVPQLCASLARKTGATTLEALTEASINEAVTIAQRTKANTTGGTVTDARVKANLDVCGDNFKHAIESLQKAAADMKSGAPYTAPVRDISAAMNYVSNCQDAFSENPGLVSPVADATSILKKMMSNCLSLAVALEMKSASKH